MKISKYTTFIFLSIIITICGVSFFYALNNRKAISADYTIQHIESYLNGNFLTVPSKDKFLYFPAASSLITVPFLLIGYPNLFGLLGFIILFLVCKKLGDTFKLNPYMSTIFAASFVTTVTVIRSINDQSVDKWLCIWFALSLIFLEKPNKSIKYFFFLGIFLGMLIGTKYSGPFFFIALIPIYIKDLLKYTNPTRIVFMSIAITVTGLFWYIRNFALTLNPYYPADVLFLKGATGYEQHSWMLLRIPFEYPPGLIDVANSYLSEFMIWSFSIFVIIWFIIYAHRNKVKIENRLKRIFFLILTTAGACLLLPITPPEKIELFHIISDMRYVYIFTILTILAVFMIAEKYKKNEILAYIAIINSIPMFGFIPYQIKLFVGSTFLSVLFFTKQQKLVDKIITKF